MRAIIAVVGGLAAIFSVLFIDSVATGSEPTGPVAGAMLALALLLVVLAGARQDLLTASIAGGAIGGLLNAVGDHAIYLAHLTGWNGLDVANFPSGDSGGYESLLFNVVVLTPMFLLAGMVFGMAVAAFSGGLNREQP